MHKRLRFWIIHECKNVKLRAEHDDIFEISHIFVEEVICIFDGNKCFIQVIFYISICKSINNIYSNRFMAYKTTSYVLFIITTDMLKINIQLYFL